MAEEKIVTEQVEQEEIDLNEAENEDQENEEKTQDENVGEESAEETEVDETEQAEKQPDPAMAQMLAELQKIKGELDQLKTSQKPQESQEQSDTFLEQNVATKTIEDKIKNGNIPTEHAQFYRQLGGLIDQMNEKNTQKTDHAIKSIFTGFREIIKWKKDVEFRGVKRTYGDKADRAQLDAIIDKSGNPFMSYDDAIQQSVLSNPALVRQILASQRGGDEKKKTFTPQKAIQKPVLSGREKFREYLIKGTNDLNLQAVNNLPFDKKAVVMEAWGEWFDKQRK